MATAPMKRPLPAAVSDPPDTKYTQALDSAMNGIGDAITAKLAEHGDHFRFQEVQRLAKIGEAIGRQKARASQRVRDFVDPNLRRAFQCDVPDGGAYGVAMGPHYGALGGAGDPNDPFAPDPLDDGVGPGIRPIGRGRIRNPDFPGDDGNPFGAMRGAFESMAESKERETESELQIDRLKELKSLRELLEDEDLPELERTVLRARKQAVLKALADANDRETQKPAPTATLPQETALRCLNPACGNAHDRDWVDDQGLPRLCDICGQPMAWSAGRPQLVEPEPPAVVLQRGQKHSCGVVVPHDTPPDDQHPFVEIQIHREEGRALELRIDVVGAHPIVEHHGGLPCHLDYSDAGGGLRTRDFHPNARAILGDEMLHPLAIALTLDDELVLRLMKGHLQHVTVFIDNLSDTPVRIVEIDGGVPGAVAVADLPNVLAPAPAAALPEAERAPEGPDAP